MFPGPMTVTVSSDTPIPTFELSVPGPYIPMVKGGACQITTLSQMTVKYAWSIKDNLNQNGETPGRSKIYFKRVKLQLIMNIASIVLYSWCRAVSSSCGLI
jgi:hypothetical protein